MKPTCQGIALRLHEWDGMKIVDEINNTYPSLGTALPCYLADDHQNQIGALQCLMCFQIINRMSALSVWMVLPIWTLC